MGAEETLKLFGMQNLLLESELRKLEDTGVQIDHAKTIRKAEIVDVELFESDIIEVAFHSSNSSNVSSESCAANFFPYFINFFAPLKNISETGECAGVNANNTVTHNVVGDAGEFHDDHAQILRALWNCYT